MAELTDFLENKIIDLNDQLALTAKNWVMSKLSNWASMGEVAHENIEPESLNMDWLKEQMGILQEKKVKGWRNDNVVSYLNTLTGQKATSVPDAISNLDEEQTNGFILKVREAVKELKPDNLPF